MSTWTAKVDHVDKIMAADINKLQNEKFDLDLVPCVMPEQYGINTIPGTTDMTAALQAAINTGKRVKLAKTTYLFSNLKIDTSAWGGISGEGKSSILKTTAAANVGLQIGTVALVENCLLENFTLQGNVTNLGGIQIGNSPQYVAWLKMRGVKVTGFTKAGNGYGIGFYCAQEVDIEDCNVSSNAINYYRPNVGSLTSCRIHGWAGYMGLSVTCGAYFDGAVSDLRFKDMVIESNQYEAIRSGRCSNIIIDNVDFEDNNITDLGAGVIDIGSTGPGYSTLNMQNCHLSETPKANPFLRLGFVRKSVVAHNETYLLSGCITGATTQCKFIDNGFQDFVTYGALAGDVWIEEWDAVDTKQRDISGFPRFSKMFVYGSPADPSLTPAVDTQLMKVKANDNIQIDFGLHGSGLYGGWIQVRDVAGGGGSKTLSINPLGGFVAIGHANPTTDLHVKRAAQVVVTAESAGDFLPYFQLKRSGGSTYTNAEWDSYIDSTGHFRLYNATTDKTPFFVSRDCDNWGIYVDGNENVGLSVSTFGGGAQKVLGLANGTAPNSHVDGTIQIFSVDSSDGDATLGLFLEQAVEDIESGDAPTHKIKAKINGAEYWIQLDAV